MLCKPFNQEYTAFSFRYLFNIEICNKLPFLNYQMRWLVNRIYFKLIRYFLRRIIVVSKIIVLSVSPLY